MGGRKFSPVPEAECDRVQDGGVHTIHDRVEFEPEDPAVEDGGAKVVMIEVGSGKFMHEVGWWGDGGMVGELGGNQRVEYLVDYRRWVEGLPGLSKGVETHPDVDRPVGLPKVVSGAVLLSRGEYAVHE